MSSPARCSRPSRAEPVRVNAKLTRNWMVSLRSLPNMTIEMRDDKTNIQANEQTKTNRFEFEFIDEDRNGMEPTKECDNVVRAD